MLTRYQAALLALGLLTMSGCPSPAPAGLPGEAETAKAADSPAANVSPTAKPLVSASSSLLAPSTTYAVISGVLSWQDPALASFSAVGRKDQALYDLLLSQGVPKAQLRLLLDKSASNANMLSAIKTMAAAAPKGSTLVFYYAGHGVKAADGNAYFACYDMNTAKSAATGFSLDALTAAIATNFHGDRVLLLADCCYSGALGAVAKSLSQKGINAVSLTSADESNVSTGNWTFSMSLLSCLTGDPLCDADGDGRIVLSELASEVRASMKHREGQLFGFATHGVSADVPLAKVNGQAHLAPDRRRDYVDARVEGKWVPARLRSLQRNQRLVRVFGYADYSDVGVSAGNTRAISFKRYAPGTALKVYWGNKLWDAKVLRADGDFHFITYPGWPSYWDEWITSQRVAEDGPADEEHAPEAKTFVVGASVQVEWHGSWYPAKVLAQQGRRHRIHYDGYEDSWDEWVGPRRIRAPR